MKTNKGLMDLHVALYKTKHQYQGNENVRFISLYGNGIHVYTGIAELAASVGAEMEVVREEYTPDCWRHSFTYRGVEFFQLSDSATNPEDEKKPASAANTDERMDTE